MKVYLNDIEFEGSPANPIYTNADMSITVCLFANNLLEVSEAAGTETDILIEDKFSGTGYKMESIIQYYEQIDDIQHNAFELRFVPASVWKVINSVQGDVAMHEEALLELAEIIGQEE